MHPDAKDKSTAELIDNISKRSEENKKNKKKFIQTQNQLSSEYDKFTSIHNTVTAAISGNAFQKTNNNNAKRNAGFDVDLRGRQTDTMFDKIKDFSNKKLKRSEKTVAEYDEVVPNCTTTIECFVKTFKEKTLQYINHGDGTKMTLEQKSHFLTISSTIMNKLIKQKFPPDLVSLYFADEKVKKDMIKDNVFWISGPPGTGKSFLINHIINFVETNKYGSISNVAWQGVTAMLMRNGGRTISSMFSVPREENRGNKSGQKIRKLSNSKLEEMKLALDSDDLILLNIDEISQVSAHCLSYVDDRLSQCMGNPNVPFGGVITIVCGDFKQLKSISKSIPSCLRSMNEPSYSKDYLEPNSP